ncbi:MAG: oligosaccharyl transferase, archaeosortase A system-associated [Haloferacaceae archaeon]
MSDEDRTDGQSVLDLFDDYYHIPALAAVAAFMLWVRLQAYDTFIQDGQVVFSGNDAWYHLRMVRYTVRHWPATMPFDPWSYFPYGTAQGQFGTLYDQLVATAALVVGLGAPSDQLVAKALLVAPAVFGALAVVPTFLIGRRIAGRGAALFGVAVLALLPGTFLQRTLVGFSDHNGAEPFFMGMAVFALLVALGVAARERPVWELVAERNWDELRWPTITSAAAGFATAMYMWAWPPGILLVGIFGVFLLVALTSDHVVGESPEYVAFVGAVSMTVTGLMMLIPFNTVGFDTTNFSLLQVLVPFGLAAMSAGIAAASRAFEERGLDRELFVFATYGSALVGAVVVALALPSVFDLVVTNLQRTVGFSAGAQTRTIAEAQPYLSPDTLRARGFVTASGAPDRVGRILADYGFTLFTGVAAAVWMATKPLVRDGDTRGASYAVVGLVLIALIYLVPAPLVVVAEQFGTVSEVIGLVIVATLVVGATVQRSYDPETLFVLVWAAFVTAAAFTQVRFNYYLAPAVAVMNAYLLGEVLSYLDVDSLVETAEDVELYQVLTVALVVMLVVTPGLLVPISVGQRGGQSIQSQTVWVAGGQASPGGYVEWQDSLAWMQNNTPAEGNLGGAGNADEFDYYGSYDRTDDFRYPNGTYGIQSWWDYGHWITVGAERIPNANPFQQGATAAANYLLAPNASAAREVLVSQSTEGEHTRYVMIDWQMATPGSKFGAPIVFYDRANVSPSEFYHRIYGVQTGQQGSPQLVSRTLVRHQRFYESQMTRLYYYHGSAQSPQPVVVDWEVRQVQFGQRAVTVNATPADGRTIKQFRSMSQARAYVRNDSTSQVGGLGPFPTERVAALEHYRLVDVSENSALSDRGYRSLRRQARATYRIRAEAAGVLDANPPSYVKTFERVPGATVQGSGAVPGANVTAEVPIRIPETNTTFTYTQRVQANDQGEFTMTLPYATTGYGEANEGYTTTSLRAEGPYNFTAGTRINDSGYVITYQTQADVPEPAVVGASDRPVEVELTRRAEPLFQDQSASGESNTTAQNQSAVRAPAAPVTTRPASVPAE